MLTVMFSVVVVVLDASSTLAAAPLSTRSLKERTRISCLRQSRLAISLQVFPETVFKKPSQKHHISSLKQPRVAVLEWQRTVGPVRHRDMISFLVASLGSKGRLKLVL